MSVYRPKNKRGEISETYVYDFELGGRRFSGNTGASSEREAKRVEKLKREQAKDRIKAEREASGAPWTFGKARTVYFKEVLKGQMDAHTKKFMTWLQVEVGDATLLTDINTAFVTQLIMKRSGEPGKKPHTFVTDATINRTVTEPLRRILRYAATVYEQRLGKITWKTLLREEPRERIRELKDDEEARLFHGLRADYHPIIRFSLVAGVRLSEACSLTWHDVDFGNRRIMITGKGGKRAPIPLPPSVREIIFPLLGHHEELVFTYEAKRTTINPTTKERLVKGQRYPITYEGLKTAFRRNKAAVKILDFRFHDLRHTAASRILRQSRNLKAVQKILRHEDITTTMRYAHVLDEDLLEAMEAGAATRSPTQNPMPEPADEKKEGTTNG